MERPVGRPRSTKLSELQLKIIILLCQDIPVKEIATQINLSVEGIHSSIQAARKVMKVSSQEALVAKVVSLITDRSLVVRSIGNVEKEVDNAKN